MTTETEEKHYYVPKFKGTKEHYPIFKIRFEAYESKKHAKLASMRDHGTDLWTEEEYYAGERSITDDPNNPGTLLRETLDDAAKELFDKNNTGFLKMVECLPDNMAKGMVTKAGPRRSMFKVKEWLEKEFGTQEIEDSWENQWIKVVIDAAKRRKAL